MGRSYQQPGGVLTYANAGVSDIKADDVVAMADTAGVALVDIPAGGSGSVATEGVFVLPKVAGTAWAQGARLDWDTSAGAFGVGITPAAGDVIGCAIAASAAGADDTVGEVKLANPGLPAPAGE